MYSLHYEHNIERVWGFHGAAKKIICMRDFIVEIKLQLGVYNFYSFLENERILCIEMKVREIVDGQTDRQICVIYIFKL
jgi:hypothetical protein